MGEGLERRASASILGEAGLDARSSRKSQRSFFRYGGHHAQVAVCARGGDPSRHGRPHSGRRVAGSDLSFCIASGMAALGLRLCRSLSSSFSSIQFMPPLCACCRLLGVEEWRKGDHAHDYQVCRPFLR